MADPILKEAMAEIMGVLKKHDIAGQITLVSKTHSEFRIKLDPTWSCAWTEALDVGTMVRFKLKKEDYPDEKQREELAGQTMHIFMQIRDLAAMYFSMFEQLGKEISKHMEVTHKGGSGYEPHRDN